MSKVHDAIRATGNAEAIAALARHEAHVASRKGSPEADESYTEPECPTCGGGGYVDDDGPQDGCSEFGGYAFCNCPAGREAYHDERIRLAEVETFALVNR